MLTNLHIENFRLFKEFKIDNLARVNLIVGKNNVGKSTLLEAIQLLVSEGSLEVLLEQLEERGEIYFDKESLGYRRGYNISHLFFGHELEDGASLQLAGSGTSDFLLQITFVRGLEGFAVEDSDRKIIDSSHLKLKYGRTKIRERTINVSGELVDRRRSRLSPPRTRFSPQSNYITTKGIEYNLLARLWDDITLTPKEDDVIKMLQILEPDVQRISFQSRQSSNSGILIKLKGQRRPLPLGSMGDGMHRILAIAASLANSENNYLLVDEIDTGLHYRTITDLWRLVFETAERLNIQVFATTHSLDGVKSFSKALDSQEDSDIAALFRLEDRGAQVVPVKYTAEELSFITEESIEVR